MGKTKLLKRGIAFIIIAAIAITTGVLTGKAIADARRGNVPLAGPVQDGDYVLPPKGKKVTDFDALQNYLYAKAVMMKADTVSAVSNGTADGKAFGVGQLQASGSTKIWDGENVYLEATSKGKQGDFVDVDEGAEAFYTPGAEVAYTRAHSAMRKELEAEGAYGYGAAYPATWKETAIKGENGFVERFGYEPRNFLPMLVNKTTVAESSFAELTEDERAALKTKSDNSNMEWNLADGETYYKISLNLNPAAADNYRRHVWYLSCSPKIPVYKEIRMEVVIDGNWVIKRIDSFENYSVWKKIPVLGEVEADTKLDAIEIWHINEGKAEIPARP